MAKKKILYEPDKNPGNIFLKAKGGKFESTPLDDILYIRANGSCTDIITLNRKHTLTARLGIIMGQLPDPRFLRVHRSYWINMHNLKSFQGRCIFMNNEEIPIGDTYMAAFKAHLDQIG